MSESLECRRKPSYTSKLALPSIKFVLFHKEKADPPPDPAVKPRRSIFISPLASIVIGCREEDAGSDIGVGSKVVPIIPLTWQGIISTHQNR